LGTLLVVTKKQKQKLFGTFICLNANSHCKIQKPTNSKNKLAIGFRILRKNVVMFKLPQHMLTNAD